MSLIFIDFHVFFYGNFFPGCLLFLFHLLSASAFDHKHTLSKRLLCLIIEDQLLDSRMECSLMSFRQFPAKSHSTISESFLQFLQSSYQSVRSLIENDSSCFILQFFQTMPALKRAVVMVQKEVADRIAAVPGNKTYGGYTAKLGLYAQVTGRFEVPPRCFMPAPHVDSTVVRIDRVDGVMPEELDREFVARVIDAAFAQRRKTIRNSMSANGFAKDVLDAAFEACGIAPTTRAETLDVADFVRLAQELIHDA